MSDFTYEKEEKVNHAEIYETYEWDNVWIEYANDKNHKRVFYIGDSISCGTRRLATMRTNEEIYFDGFGSSKAVDNPYFEDAIKLFAKQLPKIETVIFNNGLHGWHLDDSNEYKMYYEDAVKFILNDLKPDKFFILLTTSVRDEERDKRVVARNAVATEIAKKYDLPIIDLYSVTNKNKDMLIEDGVHPTEELYKLIADEIIKSIKQ